MAFLIIYLIGIILFVIFGLFVCSTNKDKFGGYNSVALIASIAIISIFWPVAVIALIVAIIVLKIKISKNAKAVKRKLDTWS